MCVCVCWQSRRTIRTVNVNRNKSKKGDERADRWEMGGAGQGKTKGGKRGMKDMALQVQWVEMLKVNVFFFSLSLSSIWRSTGRVKLKRWHQFVQSSNGRCCCWDAYIRLIRNYLLSFLGQFILLDQFPLLLPSSFFFFLNWENNKIGSVLSATY